jgi:hypothetical protein
MFTIAMSRVHTPPKILRDPLAQIDVVHPDVGARVEELDLPSRIRISVHAGARP